MKVLIVISLGLSIVQQYIFLIIDCVEKNHSLSRLVTNILEKKFEMLHKYVEKRARDYLQQSFLVC